MNEVMSSAERDELLATLEELKEQARRIRMERPTGDIGGVRSMVSSFANRFTFGSIWQTVMQQSPIIPLITSVVGEIKESAAAAIERQRELDATELEIKAVTKQLKVASATPQEAVSREADRITVEYVPEIIHAEEETAEAVRLAAEVQTSAIHVQSLLLDDIRLTLSRQNETLDDILEADLQRAQEERIDALRRASVTVPAEQTAQVLKASEENAGLLGKALAALTGGRILATTAAGSALGGFLSRVFGRSAAVVGAGVVAQQVGGFIGTLFSRIRFLALGALKVGVIAAAAAAVVTGLFSVVKNYIRTGNFMESVRLALDDVSTLLRNAFLMVGIDLDELSYNIGEAIGGLARRVADWWTDFDAGETFRSASQAIRDFADGVVNFAKTSLESAKEATVGFWNALTETLGKFFSDTFMSLRNFMAGLSFTLPVIGEVRPFSVLAPAPARVVADEEVFSRVVREVDIESRRDLVERNLAESAAFEVRPNLERAERLNMMGFDQDIQEEMARTQAVAAVEMRNQVVNNIRTSTTSVNMSTNTRNPDSTIESVLKSNATFAFR